MLITPVTFAELLENLARRLRAGEVELVSYREERETDALTLPDERVLYTPSDRCSVAVNYRLLPHTAG